VAGVCRVKHKAWPSVRLGDVAETYSGGTPTRGVVSYYNGDIPWAKIEDLTRSGMWIKSTEETISELGLANSAAVVYPAGTVLIAMYASIGTSSIAAIPLASNQAILGCVCQELLRPEFLWYWFQFKRLELLSQGRGGTQSNLNAAIMRDLQIPLPKLSDQNRIIEHLNLQTTKWGRVRTAVKIRLDAANRIPTAIAAESLKSTKTSKHLLRECLIEVKQGVGQDWQHYPVMGATRQGLAPAKDKVGKNPHRYKLVDPVTVFYNPMRILLGSIALVDDHDIPGITSPDYVVVKGRPGVLDTRWFYYWFRSIHGQNLIKSLTRGAVRERILFNRLAKGEIELPPYEVQLRDSEAMKLVYPLKAHIMKELSDIEALPAALLREVFGS